MKLFYFSNQNNIWLSNIPHLWSANGSRKLCQKIESWSLLLRSELNLIIFMVSDIAVIYSAVANEWFVSRFSGNDEKKNIKVLLYIWSNWAVHSTRNDRESNVLHSILDFVSRTNCHRFIHSSTRISISAMNNSGWNGRKGISLSYKNNRFVRVRLRFKMRLCRCLRRPHGPPAREPTKREDLHPRERAG